MAEQKKRKKISPKEQGNREERKQAKLLSEWMFNDSKLLRRSSDSGAQGVNYTGDIVPEGQLPPEWNLIFPFHIESKNGYENHIPDFWSYAKLRGWSLKCFKELTHQQQIIMLITQFYRKSALLTTNICICTDPVLPYLVNFPAETSTFGWATLYVYRLKDVLDRPFSSIYNIKELCNG